MAINGSIELKQVPRAQLKQYNVIIVNSYYRLVNEYNVYFNKAFLRRQDISNSTKIKISI